MKSGGFLSVNNYDFTLFGVAVSAMMWCGGCDES